MFYNLIFVRRFLPASTGHIPFYIYYAKNAVTPAIGSQFIERQPFAVAGELQPPVIPATAAYWPGKGNLEHFA